MKLKYFFLTILIFGVLFGFVVLQATVADPVLAATIIRASPSSTGQGAPGVDLTIQKLFDIIVGLACYLIRISIILIVIAVLFYGFKFLISQGDLTKVGEAKKALGWGVIGILVIFSTYTIIKTVNVAVGGSASNITLLNCSGR